MYCYYAIPSFSLPFLLKLEATPPRARCAPAHERRSARAAAVGCIVRGPTPRPRSSQRALFTPAEMIVYAGAEDVLLQRNIVRRKSAAAGAVEAAEIDAQVFRLRAPIARQRQFDAGARGPAGIDGLAAGKARRRRANVADGETAGDVWHDPIERIADAAAHGEKPTVAGAASDRATRRRALAVESGPVGVGLDAEHDFAELLIVADCAAGLAAGKTDSRGVAAPDGMAPAAAAVGAEIKAGPAIGLRRLGRRRLVERRERQVGRGRALNQGRRRQPSEQNPFHCGLPTQLPSSDSSCGHTTQCSRRCAASWPSCARFGYPALTGGCVRRRGSTATLWARTAKLRCGGGPIRAENRSSLLCHPHFARARYRAARIHESLEESGDSSEPLGDMTFKQPANGTPVPAKSRRGRQRDAESGRRAPRRRPAAGRRRCEIFSTVIAWDSAVGTLHQPTKACASQARRTADAGLRRRFLRAAPSIWLGGAKMRYRDAGIAAVRGTRCLTMPSWKR